MHSRVPEIILEDFLAFFRRKSGVIFYFYIWLVWKMWDLLRCHFFIFEYWEVDVLLIFDEQCCNLDFHLLSSNIESCYSFEFVFNKSCKSYKRQSNFDLLILHHFIDIEIYNRLVIDSNQNLPSSGFVFLSFSNIIMFKSGTGLF